MPTLLAIGCSSGLGLGALSHWCRRLVSLPPRASQWRILAARRAPLDSSPTPEQDSLAALCTAHPHSVHLEWLALDLASSDSVRAFAHQVRNCTDTVDVLVLNAAVWTADADPASFDVGGQEWTQEAVINALAQHLLVDLVEPLLVAAADEPTSSSTRPRIIVTTSKLHSSVTSLDDLVAQLHPPFPSTSTSASPPTTASTGKSRYAASKALQLVSAAFWASRLAESGVDVVAVSPGFVPTTSLSRAQSPVARWAMRHVVSWLPFAVSAEEGAARIARCFPLGVEPRSPSPSPSSSSARTSPSSPDLAHAAAAPPPPPPPQPQDELVPLFDALRAASPSPTSSVTAAPPFLYLTAPSTSPLTARSTSPLPPPRPPRRSSPPSPPSPRASPSPSPSPAALGALDVGGGVAQALIERACAEGRGRQTSGGGGAASGEEEEEEEGGEGAARARGWDDVGRAVLGRLCGEGEVWGDGEGWSAVRRWDWGGARGGASETDDERERERVRDELGVD
ncbi:hypothetical protein JCM8208_005250 [Rhodotorula glutinis]